MGPLKISMGPQHLMSPELALAPSGLGPGWAGGAGEGGEEVEGDGE